MSQGGGYDQASDGRDAPPAPGVPPGFQQRTAVPSYVAPTNGLAIAALIVAFVFAPAGLVMGIIAKSQIAQSGEQGDGLATAAIVVSAVFLAIAVLAIVGLFVLFAAVAANVHVGGSSTGVGVRLLVRR